MRFISTLYFLLVSSIVFSQAPLIDCKVGEKNNDTTKSSLTNGATGKAQGLNVQTVSKGVTGTICYSFSVKCNNPLLIVDGEIWPLSRLSSLNPNDIESVEILKSSVAIAIYGSNGACGVVMVTLKRPASTIIRVKDNLDKSALSKATVTFVIPVRDDTLRYIADDSGRIVTNSPRTLAGCRMIISAVGYRPETRVWSADMVTSDQYIFLSRDGKNCDEVIVGAPCWKRSECYGQTCAKVRSAQFNDLPRKIAINVYPNPARPGEQVNISFDGSVAENLAVRLSDAAGQIVQARSAGQVNGNNIIPIQTNPAWTPGIYFLQVMYENGRVAASGKIIIQ